MIFNLIKNLSRKFDDKRNFLILAVISIIAGSLLISFNFLAQRSNRNEVHFQASDDKNKSLVTRTNDFTHAFELKDVKEINSLEIKLKITHMNQTTVLHPQFNDKNLEDIGPGTKGSLVQTYKVKGEFKKLNKFEIEGDFNIGFKVYLEELKISRSSLSKLNMYFLFNIIGFLILAGPILIVEYGKYLRRKEISHKFPEFLDDVVEGTRAGMTLPKAIKNVKNNDYGSLSPYVRKMCSKLDWGVSFESVLKSFSGEINNETIDRAVSTIVQTYKTGGKISKVLEAVGNNLREIERLKAERKNQLYGEMVTGYLVYFTFLAAIVGLIKFLLPNLSIPANISSLNGGMTTSLLISKYRPLFRHLILIQSLFSGLVIGKLSEGKLKAGIKHTVILLFIGYSVSVLLI